MSKNHEIIIETERLLIREIVASDLDVMLEMHSDPEVHRYLGNNTITSPEKMKEAMDELTCQYREYGLGRWAMIEKGSGDFIGWTGLEYVTHEINQHKDFYDLGYRLLKRYWGQGYATESAVASVDYAFEVLQASEIYAMADIENEGSNKILKKVGLHFVETFDLEGVEHNWYRLERLQYLKQKSPNLAKD